jgi:hypothetical protein
LVSRPARLTAKKVQPKRQQRSASVTNSQPNSASASKM